MNHMQAAAEVGSESLLSLPGYQITGSKRKFNTSVGRQNLNCDPLRSKDLGRLQGLH